MKTILVLGRNGQVGFELQRTLAPLGKVVALDSWQLDLNKSDVIRRVVGEAAPAIIVNAAAYTAVDKAESEPDIAMRVNGEAPGVLAEEAKKLGALLVHYSTDYVFDGGKSGAYVETDDATPTSTYGRSKLAGEQAIQAACRRHLIFRTSWVYGARGANFLLTMRRLMRERPELKIVADQIGAPTWSRMLAEATALILAQQVSPARGADRPEPWGVYHMTNGGETSWHGFAEAIQALDGGESKAMLLPIPSSDYPTPAKRPLNSRLDNDKLERVFGVRLPDWRVALELCMRA